MLTEQHPSNGADFMRLDLLTVRQGFETLQADGGVDGSLSAEQCQWFRRYLTAWEFYRPSQPERYQEEVETLIAAIYGYRVEPLAA